MKLYYDIIWWFYFDDEMLWRYDDGYVVLWASMGWPVIEATYGETMIHSIKAVWEILAREEWLGCHHDASPMLDILRLTPLWAPCMIFSSFLDIKSMCIFFKIYMYYKRNTSGLWICPGPMMFRELFYRPWWFLKKSESTDLLLFYFEWLISYLT